MTAEDWITFDYHDEDLCEQPNQWEEFRNTSSTKWMLKDKTIIKIKDVETQHILNSIKFLIKCGQGDCKAYAGLSKELKIRLSNP